MTHVNGVHHVSKLRIVIVLLLLLSALGALQTIKGMPQGLLSGTVAKERRGYIVEGSRMVVTPYVSTQAESKRFGGTVVLSRNRYEWSDPVVDRLFRFCGAQAPVPIVETVSTSATIEGTILHPTSALPPATIDFPEEIVNQFPELLQRRGLMRLTTVSETKLSVRAYYLLSWLAASAAMCAVLSGRIAAWAVDMYRSRLRRDTGLCVNCGYSVGKVDAPCPECNCNPLTGVIKTRVGE